MEKHIKQRIYKIRNNEITDGYKHSRLGVIPADWSIKELKDIATVNPKKTLLANEEMVSFLGMADVSENAKVIELQTKPYGEVAKGFTSFIDNDILVAKITPCFENGKGALVKNLSGGVGFGSTEFHIIRTEKPEDRKFVFYHTTSHRFRKTGEKNMTGTAGQKRVPADFIENYLIQYPGDADERVKIAEVLSTCDKAIELKEKLIEEKKKQKTGLIQKLYTGEVRIPGFSGKVKFERLNKYIKDSKEKNRNNQEKRVLSVTNKLGFVLQEDQFDRIVASKDLSNYKIVRKGQFAYNPSRVNVGSIDLLTTFESGLLSPMYVVFQCKQGLVTEYLYHFIKSDMFLKVIPNFLQGSVRDSLSFDSLGLVKIFIPSVEEQNAIAQRLNLVDKEILLLEKELECLKQQKKGLMQLLLTGIVRVNTQES